jgi:hypothetical protein
LRCLLMKSISVSVPEAYAVTGDWCLSVVFMIETTTHKATDSKTDVIRFAIRWFSGFYVVTRT